MVRAAILTGVGMAMIGGLAAAVRPVQPASLAAREGACTAAWLVERDRRPQSERYDRNHADAFGRQCLGVTGRVPIDWSRVRSDLAAAITTASPLVGTTPADIDTFCPGYRRADAEGRAAFWRELAYQTIKPEAGTNAHALMWEQPVRDGRPTGGYYSIGLLQLSFHDARPYGCAFPSERSLLDPSLNIACGARIIERLVARDGRIGGDADYGRKGLGAYWSTIRVIAQKPRASGQRETRGPILKAVRDLPQCRA